MASLKMFRQTYSYFFTILLLVGYCSCFNPKSLNASLLATESAGFLSAGATWYGATDDGACGYKGDVGQPPFSSMISAGGPSLFKSGQGCGNCYQVKCTTNPSCSGNPVTVVITDECPGCVSESTHFDLSITAFGAMAKPGNELLLKNVGRLPIEYQRVKCNYPGTNRVFKVDAGSNPSYFATLVEYQNTESYIDSIELQDISSNWRPMQQLRSAVWKLDSTTALNGPFSLRLKSADWKMIVAQNVIPAGWRAGTTYGSHINF